MRLVLLFAAVAGTACPQILSVGVKGGVPLTDAIDAASNQSVRYISNTKRYLVGPTVELNLPLHVSIEFDALYRRENYESRTNLIDGFSTGATTANSWEFPLLLKWRFSGGPIRPFVDAGFSFDKLSDIHQLTRTFIAPNLNTSTTTDQPPELRNTFRAGGTIGAGIELGARHLRVAPEIRYTRWGRENFRDLTTGGILHSNDNEASFLLGITF